MKQPDLTINLNNPQFTSVEIRIVTTDDVLREGYIYESTGIPWLLLELKFTKETTNATVTIAAA